MLNRKRLAVSLVALLAVLGIMAGTAYAAVTYRVGGFTTRQYFLDETTAYGVPNAGFWNNVPNAGLTVTVPAGTSRLVNARYNAESQCTGPGWCSVRLLYAPLAGGAAVELSPQSGSDYAFDSAGGTWESHSVERTTRAFLPAGQYRVQVQAMRVGGATSFRLDDYHLAVSLVAP